MGYSFGISLLVLSIAAQTFGGRLVCYYGSWSVYNEGNDAFEVEDIDPFVCTHVIYSFVGLQSDGSVTLLDPWNDIGDEWHEGAFQKFVRLRQTNPNLKLMVAIGGWNEGSETYSQVANNPTLRANLVRSATNLVSQYNFDGFDVDWEYPSQRGGQPSDKQAFSALLRELRASFDQHGYLLSAAVSASPDIISQAYEVPVLSQYLDFINVMTYDYHGSWEYVTGHCAPLHDYNGISVESTIDYWINQGAAPNKINLGVPFYGNTYTLSNSNNHGVGAPATPSGQVDYHDVCTAGGWTTYWDDTAKVPYAVNGNQWVGYDNPQSVREKSSFATSRGLGGVMVWSIESDDFDNLCGQGRYPLLNAIKSAQRF